VGTAGGKRVETFLITDDKEFSATVVDHLTGLIVFRKTNLKGSGRSIGHAWPKKIQYRYQKGC
jgi:hypothetical protein